MSEYRKIFNETKDMYFLIKDNELLEKYNKTWDKVSNTIKKWFDSEDVYHEKYLQTKIKSWKEKSIQIFIMRKFPKKVLIAFFYRWFWLFLFWKWVKTVILKNV